MSSMMSQPVASTCQIVIHTLMMVTLEVFDEQSLGDSEVCLSAAMTIGNNFLCAVGDFISSCHGDDTSTS